MLGDMLDSRLLQIDAKSSSSVAISPTNQYFSVCRFQLDILKVLPVTEHSLSGPLGK